MEFRKMVTMTLYGKQQKKHKCKEQSLNSVGEDKGGMIWEGSIETNVYIIICEADCQSSFDAWDRVLRAGALDDPGGWDAEGGGRGILDGEHMCACGWFMSIFGKNHYNIIK